MSGDTKWRLMKSEREEDLSLCRKTFAPVGEDWPQLDIAVYPDLHKREGRVNISVSEKAGPDDWWENCGLPLELVPYLVGLLNKLGVR